MSKFIKFIISILVMAVILWLGGNIMKSVLAYDLFEPAAEMILKSDKPYDAVYQTIFLYSSLSFYTTVGYLTAFVSVLLITVHYRKNMKKYGWLFMALVLFFISSPVEFIKLYYDIQLSIAVYINGITDISHQTLNKFFIQKYQSGLLPSLSALSIFANITAILLVIWKPLEKSDIK
jgi:transposase